MVTQSKNESSFSAFGETNEFLSANTLMIPGNQLLFSLSSVFSMSRIMVFLNDSNSTGPLALKAKVCLHKTCKSAYI